MCVCVTNSKNMQHTEGHSASSLNSLECKLCVLVGGDKQEADITSQVKRFTIAGITKHCCTVGNRK